MTAMVLDKKDWQILEALQADARQSLAALGKRVGLSQPAMSERVRKLEEAGVIEGYGARINLRAVGVGLQAIIRIQTDHTGIQPYLKLFATMPEVLEADRVTGADCFVVRCAIAQPEDLERVVDALAAHGAVTTALVLSSPIRKGLVRPGCTPPLAPAPHLVAVAPPASPTSKRQKKA